MSLGRANHLSLNLEECQESQATAWENNLQYDEEGQNNEDSENGV